MVIKEDFSRRKFIRYSVIGGAIVPLLSGVPYENEVYGGVFNAPKDLENLTEMERIHLPKVTLPPVVDTIYVMISVENPRKMLNSNNNFALFLLFIIQYCLSCR